MDIGIAIIIKVIIIRRMQRMKIGIRDRMMDRFGLIELIPFGPRKAIGMDDLFGL